MRIKESVIAFLLMALPFASNAMEVKTLVGQWEGIVDRSAYTYVLLSIDKNHNGQIAYGNIAHQLKHVKRYKISAENIRCDGVYCAIELTNHQNPKESKTLLLSGEKKSEMMVLDIDHDGKQRSILRNTYRLASVSGKSTAQTFIEDQTIIEDQTRQGLDND